MSSRNIESAVSVLTKSPIRKYLNENKECITLFEEERKLLNKIDDIIASNLSNLENPLKVVVLGEVKAGKSTLINSLIQKEVVYTNVVEATASIIEIKYDVNENIVIKYNSGEESKVKSVKELDRLMDENRTNQEFFKNIKQVNINTNMDRLKKISIVDTPGLNTITSENAQRTNEYIKNSDVILWVLNAHNLGQSDVIDKIEEVLEYGKPIIGIVNRVDEIDGDEEEVLEYVQDEMGYVFDEIFTTSAKKAWDGFLQSNSIKVEESRVNTLYEFIINNIESKSKDVQIKSVESSTISQIKNDLYIHRNTKNKLNTLLNKIDEDLNSLKEINHNMKKIILNKMNEWLKYEFFENEKNSLSRCTDKSEYVSLLKKYTDEEYIGNIINRQYNNMGNYIAEEWKAHSNEFIEKKMENIQFSIQIDGFENTVPIQYSSSDEIMKGAKNGGVAAGAMGLGLAGYAAWLGPAASYVTIGGAVGAFLPPLLIAGAAGGAVWNYLKKDKEKISQYNQVEVLVEGIKTRFKNDILNDIINKLNQLSDYYHEHTVGIICDILNQCNTSQEEVERINIELPVYIECLDNELK